VASHIAGITKSGNAKFSQLPWRQNILLKISQSRMDKPSIHSGKSLCPNSYIRHCRIATLTLTAKYLDENIKNLAFTNPTYTAASHFSRITKSGNAKFQQLHWQQNILLKISKI